MGAGCCLPAGVVSFRIALRVGGMRRAVRRGGAGSALRGAGGDAGSIGKQTGWSHRIHRATRGRRTGRRAVQARPALDVWGGVASPACFPIHPGGRSGPVTPARRLLCRRRRSCRPLGHLSGLACGLLELPWRCRGREARLPRWVSALTRVASRSAGGCRCCYWPRALVMAALASFTQAFRRGSR